MTSKYNNLLRKIKLSKLVNVKFSSEEEWCVKFLDGEFGSLITFRSKQIKENSEFYLNEKGDVLLEIYSHANTEHTTIRISHIHIVDKVKKKIHITTGDLLQIFSYYIKKHLNLCVDLNGTMGIIFSDNLM